MLRKVLLSILGTLISWQVFAQISQNENTVMMVYGHGLRREIVPQDLIPPQKNKSVLETLSAHYAPYAMLSARVYWKGEEEGKWLELKEKTTLANKKSLRDIFFAEWDFVESYVGGEEVCTSKPCFKSKGFEAHIYKTKSCSEIVIAFRGTDGFTNLTDMKTNLRWLVPPPLRSDQVTELIEKAPELWREAVKACPNKSPRLVTTGHSLGGNLAQTAAYYSNHYDDEGRYISKGKPIKIAHVYAFDTSPVTGATDNYDVSMRNATGLRIDRIYEHGEILAYLRMAARTVLPFKYCEPQIRGIRFELLHGGIIKQHSIVDLASSFMQHGKKPAKRQSRYLVDTAVMDIATGECNLDPTRAVPSNSLR